MSITSYLNNYPKNLSLSNSLYNSIFDEKQLKKTFEDIINTFNFPSDIADAMNTEYKSSYLQEDGITFAFPTPGYEKSELKVMINKNTLSISAKSEREEFKNSISFSSYIPKSLDLTKEVTSEYKNGMLFVKFEKKNDESIKEREVIIS
jgi:HSP20 family molecular chaperone IbpA